jgi:hypothetical protein
MNLKPSSILVGNIDEYPVIEKFSNNLPLLKSQRGNKIRVSKYWRHFSFTESNFWNSIQRRNHLKYLNLESELLFTCEAIDYKFIVSPVKIYDGKGILDFTKTQSALQLELLFKTTLSNSLKKLGFYKGISKQAIYGLVDENDQEEIKSKFGSYADYLYTIQK